MTQMILSASIMIALAVLIRRLAIHRLPKRVFVIIWGLVSIRLLIPFSLPDAFSMLHVSNLPILDAISAFGSSNVDPSMLMTSVPVALPAYVMEYSAGTILAQPSVNWSLILLILWILGSVLLAFFFLISHMKFRRKLSTSLPLEHAFVTDWLALNQTARTVQVRYSDQISSPLTYGISRPVIVLPTAMDLSDDVRLNYVLMHEHVHIRRFDYVWKLLFAAVLCVHWFNPLVWLMYVCTNRDVELSCDEAVLGLLGQKSKASYGLALLDLAERNTRLAFASGFSKHALDERIRVMARAKRKSVLGAIAVLLLITCTMMILAAPLVEAAQSHIAPNVRDDITQTPGYLSQNPTDPAPEPEYVPAASPPTVSEAEQEAELPSHAPLVMNEEAPSERPLVNEAETYEPPVSIPDDWLSLRLANERPPVDDSEFDEFIRMDHIAIPLHAFGVSSLEELALYFPDAFHLLIYFPDEFHLLVRTIEQGESDRLFSLEAPLAIP